MNQVNEREKFVPQYLWAPEGNSIYEQLLAKPKEYRQKWLSKFSEKEKQALQYSWKFLARPRQLPPPDDFIDHPFGWKYWCVLAGRGYGKTRLAAEYVKYRIENGLSKRIALIGPTYRDVIKTMLKGESGLLSLFKKTKIKAKFVYGDNTVYFRKGKNIIAEAYVYTGQEPERLRGPQHDFAWFDELAAFDYLEEVWFLFVAGHRLGKPQAVFTTTPKITLLKINILNDPQTVCSFGSTKENKVNLAEGTVESLENIYENSDFAEQELEGALYLDSSGSIFQQSWINKNRLSGKLLLEGDNFYVQTQTDKIQLVKIAVAVDPSGSTKDAACECGIVVCGQGSDGYGYVIEDLSKKVSADEWAKIVVLAAQKYKAYVVAETNFGGGMVKSLIQKAAKELGFQVRVIEVTAQRDKVQRALLVSPPVQTNKVKFLGHFTKLERQLTTWQIGDTQSPDRMDAFVWAMTNLIVKQLVRNVQLQNIF